MAEPDRIEQLGLPDLGAAPEDDDLENQSGLGRGLSSIIPQLAGLDDADPSPHAGGLASLIPGADEAPVEPDAEPTAGSDLDGTAVRQLRDDLVRALLDGLVNTMRLDLCGYVHRENDDEPELFLRSPALATLGPERAWALFGALRTAVARNGEDGALAVAGLHGRFVATAGPRSNGVFALAREDGLTAREQQVALRFCSSFGQAVHQLAADRLREAGDEGEALSIEVHEARDSILARVQVESGGRVGPGSARAETRVEAVTRAVIDAHDDELVFRYASEVAHGGEHAAVVLIEAPTGAVALGSAVTRAGGGRATAHAAARAVAGLSGRADRSSGAHPT